jgi:Electron transfer DM13
MIGHMRRLFRRPVTWVVMTIALAGLVVGLLLFEPWRLFTHSRVDEPVPVAANETPAPPPSTAPTTSQPEVLAEGTFVTQEHPTSGTAKILKLTDGTRVLRLEGFSTSDGPDVHVWLTDQKSGGPDGSYDDGRYVKLGELKATDGNQNYPIPADARLEGLRSAVIWCDRFNVAFGSAPLGL